MRTRTRTAAILASLLAATSLPPFAASAAASIDPVGQGAFSAFLVGRFAAQASDPQRAADSLQFALRADPNIPEIEAQAFLASLFADQPTAVEDAARLPANPIAQLVVANAKAKSGQWSDAEAAYAAIGDQAGVVKLLRPVLIAWARAGQHDIPGALDILAPIVSEQHLGGVYALHAALIADLGGRTEQAERLYAIAQQQFGASNLRLTQIVASWQARQGQVALAQQTIDALVTQQPELAMARTGLRADVSQPPVRNGADGIAEVYLALAATLRPQSPDLARAMLHLALDMRPDLVAGRILLADIAETDKQTDLALAALAPVPASDPLLPVVELRRATFLGDAGRRDDALAILHRLAAEHPESPEPATQEGDLLRVQNDYADAARAYAEAIARIGTPSRSNWPLFYARGIARERSGDWAGAESDLRFSLELSPDQPSVQNYLAYSWTERGEHLDEARAMLDRAVAARPTDGAIIDSLGWLLLKQGDVAEAVARLTKAAELLPEDPTINGHLGDALAAAGRWREAVFQWQFALILKPDEQDAKRINERLAALPPAAR